MRPTTNLCTALLLTCCAFSVHARDTRELPVWEVGVGIGALALPDYPGADEEQFYAAPIPWFVYRGERFRADRGGLQGLFYSGDNVRLDLSFSGSVPVDSDDNAARRGMDDLDPGFEVGPSLNIDLHESPRHTVETRLRGRALYSFDRGNMHYEGWILNPVLRWNIQPTAQLEWELSLRGYYGDDGYHDFYYGVDPEFVTANRAAYDGEAGYGGAQLRLGITADIRRDWKLRSSLSWRDLNGVVFDDSPLFKRDHGVFFNIFLVRTLYRSAGTSADYEE